MDPVFNSERNNFLNMEVDVKKEISVNEGDLDLSSISYQNTRSSSYASAVGVQEASQSHALTDFRNADVREISGKRKKIKIDKESLVEGVGAGNTDKTDLNPVIKEEVIMDPSVSSENKEFCPSEIFVKDDIGIKDEDLDFSSMSYENTVVENHYNTRAPQDKVDTPLQEASAEESAHMNTTPSDCPATQDDTGTTRETTTATSTSATAECLVLDVTQSGEVLDDMTTEEETEDDSNRPQNSHTDTQADKVKTPPRKRKRSATINLDVEVEKDLAEWFQKQRFLYDKGMRDHKDGSKKSKVLAEKAAEVGGGITGLQIWKWFNSMRTRLGKLTKIKSGPAARKPPTEREGWILATFGSWLQPHIDRQPTRSLGYAKKTALPPPKRPPSRTSDEEEREEEGDEDVAVDDSSLAAPPSASAPARLSKSPRCRLEPHPTVAAQISTAQEKGVKKMQELIDLVGQRNDAHRAQFSFVEQHTCNYSEDLRNMLYSELAFMLARYAQYNKDGFVATMDELYRQHVACQDVMNRRQQLPAAPQHPQQPPPPAGYSQPPVPPPPGCAQQPQQAPAGYPLPPQYPHVGYPLLPQYPPAGYVQPSPAVYAPPQYPQAPAAPYAPPSTPRTPQKDAPVTPSTTVSTPH